MYSDKIIDDDWGLKTQVVFFKPRSLQPTPLTLPDKSSERLKLLDVWLYVVLGYLRRFSLTKRVLGTFQSVNESARVGDYEQSEMLVFVVADA